ncbi:xanthine and CO dehydrogenase family maturation factor XdhC/CoxF family protein [Cellvibrio zantedeschiae]|uniref:Xanthine and CO dehydrogenase family maturation factor XdhC/CoxF family protein n=1 Tax=Cellvibrio zantedeschiae TaxID=1237077 RepID=A0ABQ3B483_9GAMM|nr:XdhC family protein [Cellvibrio zantedeschiae]GGY73830.1 xanthine and CO dehydrogenase family maturation factor XdhC/CoxF family protein [Cellvibrio zantedeschiae]
MSNHFYHLLSSWLPLKEEANWVLGAVINTRGSVYRKTGALMLLSDAGHQLGLLSGGCLESDLLLQARKVIALGKSRQVVYDASDDSNIAWRLGIGCGGAAEILLHPCNAQNDFLQLPEIFSCLQDQACNFELTIAKAHASFTPCMRKLAQRQHGKLEQKNNEQILSTLINPLPHLLVLGNGVDVIPLCQLAVTLGWRVTLADQRLNANKRAHFPTQINALSISADELDDEFLQQVDGIVIAHHNIRLDAAAIAALQTRTMLNPYIGLLGPAHRKADVLACAGLSEEQLKYPVAGPMGLALGGDLPESIALSVLAECHAKIFGSSALPLHLLASGENQLVAINVNDEAVYSLCAVAER